MGLLGLKETEETVKDEPSPSYLNLALGTPVFDQTPVSEIRMVNIFENATKDIDDVENNLLLMWRVKKPIAPLTPALAKDQVGTTKGKENVTEETLVVARSYTTKGIEKKLLSDAMVDSKAKITQKKRQKHTIVVE